MSGAFEGPTETLTEPIVGWRAWRVDDGPRLWGVILSSRLAKVFTQKYVSSVASLPKISLRSASEVVAAWLPGVTNEAEHLWRAHPCEGFISKHCGCGFWAYKDLETFQRYSAHKDSMFAIGRVSLWGKIVVGELGYRAEKAYPLDLWLPDFYYEEYATAIRDTYKIEVYKGYPWTDPDFKEGRE